MGIDVDDVELELKTCDFSYKFSYRISDTRNYVETLKATDCGERFNRPLVLDWNRIYFKNLCCDLLAPQCSTQSRAQPAGPR